MDTGIVRGLVFPEAIVLCDLETVEKDGECVGVCVGWGGFVCVCVFSILYMNHVYFPSSSQICMIHLASVLSFNFFCFVGIVVHVCVRERESANKRYMRHLNELDVEN